MKTFRAALLAGMALAAGPAALAEDLRSALVSAYNTNPQLQAARAQQRALDETVPIEKADALPAVSASASHTEVLDKTDLLGPGRILQGSVSAGVPIYAGGGIRNSIRAAETRVDVPETTVSDAVMMLDLRNTNALLFKNAGTGKHNMVYRRGDGSIGWVEPS